MTSDLDALGDLAEEGLEGLISGVLSVRRDQRHAARARPAARPDRAGRVPPDPSRHPVVPAPLPGHLPADPLGDRGRDRAVHRDDERPARGAVLPPGAAQRGDLRPAQRARTPAPTATPSSRWRSTRPPSGCSATSAWSPTMVVGRDPGDRRRPRDRRAGRVPAVSCGGCTTRSTSWRCSTTPISRRPRRWRRSAACSRSRRACPSRRIPSRSAAGRTPRGGDRRRRPVRRRRVRLRPRRPGACRTFDLHIPAGQTVAVVGATGRRQVDAGQAARPVLRPHRGPRAARRRRRPARSPTPTCGAGSSW